jgi:Na+-translocating ferredoxin:NAD+ oxidoreductase RnfD subunit
MLIQDITNSLHKIEFDQKKIKEKRNDKLKNIALWGLLLITIILMQRKIISWYIPSVLLALVVVSSVIDHNKKNKFKRK